jgi:hypothetical protein
MVILGALISITAVAAVLKADKKESIIEISPVDAWTPTKEDIAYQDSMFKIVEQTQQDVDTIREAIDVIMYKLERIDYENGTWDSIRYVKGGKIDHSRSE